MKILHTVQEFLIVSVFLFSLHSQAMNLPVQPEAVDHPGSNSYRFSFRENKFDCLGRESRLVIPINQTLSTMVVFGHGQALDFEAYKETFFHLAKKGIVVLYPQYDRGFFDRQWIRMASDYNAIINCALKNLPQDLQIEFVVYSGHSKGAYVASIAASLESNQASSLLLLNSADIDEKSWSSVPSLIPVTIVTSDRDKVISDSVSKKLYEFSRSKKKQLIKLKSYTANERLLLEADHFWPLSKKRIVGGREVNAFHYFGLWKWLTAIALSPFEPERFSSYIYGDLASGKGVLDIRDDIIRNF
jgi:alpha/beta superfamily hydrolase